MTDSKPDHLKSVGGFAEVVGHLIPDISVPPEEDLTTQPTWQATVYVQFSDNDRLVQTLNKLIEDKLKGRLPTSTVGKDIADNYYLLAHFLVADNSDESEDLVDSFADGVVDAIGEASEVFDSHTEIDFVGEENQA